MHEVPGIKRCFVAKAANTNAASQRNAVTEGVNLRQLWQIGHGLVDLNRLGTNDVGAILRTYGVEAARSSIINEMSAVFSVYGIGVDYRHLTVIADYMVRSCVCQRWEAERMLTCRRPWKPDLRRWLQAVQPYRSLEQLLAVPQGFVR